MATPKLDPKVKAANALARRNNRIQEMRDKQLTLREIGERVGLTGSRVYKVLRATREHTFYGATRMSFHTVAQA